jgi:hypothetical protein
MSDRVLIEICVGSVDDAVTAVAAGADRLELNCALSLGGLTPSGGLFAEVRRHVAVPLIAMVRPRPGGFCYSQTDFDVMLRDAEALLAAGPTAWHLASCRPAVTSMSSDAAGFGTCVAAGPPSFTALSMWRVSRWLPWTRSWICN